MKNEEKNCIICVKYANSEIYSDCSVKYVKRIFENAETEENGVLVVTQRPNIMLVPNKKDATRMTEKRTEELKSRIYRFGGVRDLWVEKD